MRAKLLRPGRCVVLQNTCTLQQPDQIDSSFDYASHSMAAQWPNKIINGQCAQCSPTDRQLAHPGASRPGGWYCLVVPPRRLVPHTVRQQRFRHTAPTPAMSEQCMPLQTSATEARRARLAVLALSTICCLHTAYFGLDIWHTDTDTVTAKLHYPLAQAQPCRTIHLRQSDTHPSGAGALRGG